MAIVYHVLSTGNYAQDWSNAGLITTNDTWPDGAVIGYRGDDITTTIGADPQTVLGVGTEVIDVNANQTNPNTFATGGVTEFAITNPTVAIKGSATADAPNLVFFMDATGRQDITFSFDARDIDGSANDATQQIAVQYRIGTSGNFINIPAGFISDATTANAATQSTSISVTLPSGANNQSQVQIRVITINATGTDEWVGIDNIVVSSSALAVDSTPPTLSSSSPADDATSIAVGSNIVLTFNEAVQMITGGGAIEIRRSSDNSLVESFTQANVGGTVTVSGATVTLNPTADLAAGTDYYVTIAATAVEDTAGNDFAGFSAPTTLNFTTTAAAAATLAVDDVAITEGASGTQILTFTVSRSNTTTAFSVDYATADSTATVANSDYAAATGTLTFTVGGALTQTVSVTVNGDTAIELDEAFALNLSNIVNASGGTTFTDNAGAGTITNDDFSRIYDIQGAGHRAPLVGGAVGAVANSGAARVSVEGVVTAITTNGFYLQDETGDGNINTSDGIFVFVGAAPAATITLGERLRINNARVDEFRSGTATNDLTVTQLNVGTAVPGASITELNTTAVIAPVIIGAAGRSPPQTGISDPGFTTFDPAVDAADFWESLEGMLVTVDNPIAISGTSDFSGSEELWVVAQGAFDPASLNGNGGLTIAPGDQNSERIQIDDLITALTFPDVTAGATLADITGIVNYSFTNYEVLVGTAAQVLGGSGSPTVLTPGILTAPETTSVVAQPRQLTIANYNFENLDPGDGAARFNAFAAQMVNVLNSPVIITGQEIQDNDGATNSGTTSSSLTASTMINAIIAAGGPTYAYVDVAPANNTSGGEPGGNIRPGIFYRSDLVQIVGTPVTLDVPAFDGSRDPLVVTFKIIASGVEFTLINNHFSSKGGDNGVFGNVQPPVLNSEPGRIAQAQVVNDYVDSLLALNPGANIVVAGDLNDFGFSPPVQTLIGGGAPVLTNLADALIATPTDRYSYNFNGNSQELDHMLASGNAYSVATVFDVVHVNADFGRLQLSDHDPSIALFDARQLAETLLGLAGDDTILGFGGNDSIDGAGGADVLNGGLGADTILGGAGADVIYGLDGADSMVGGADNDIYFVENIGDIVVEVAGEGVDYVYTTVSITLADNADNLILLGAATTGVGTLGNDNLYGNSATGPVSLSGLVGNDLLYGGAGADTLVGGAGLDTLIGLGGADSMTGGDDNDVYVIDDAGDSVTETAAGGVNDIVYASVSVTLADNVETLVLLGGATAATGTAGNDSLYGLYATGPVSLSGNGGNDLLYGGGGADTLDGGAGADTIVGGAGDDSMVGGADNDIYLFDQAGDSIVELDGGGFDSVYVSVNTTAAAFAEQWILTGAATAVTGSSGADYLYGHVSANSVTLDGAGGNDYLLGSAQNDTLIGGLGDDGIDLTQGGDDRVRYAAGGDMGDDVIYGFDADPAGGQDLIDLAGRGYAAGDMGGAIALIDIGGAHTIAQFTSGSLAGTQLFLYGVAIANVTAADFVLV
jgi:predicted extracellular nuclease